MVLAIPGRVVAVLSEYLRERAIALRHQRVVAREARGQLHDHAGGVGMMIASGEQRRRVGEQSAVV